MLIVILVLMLLPYQQQIFFLISLNLIFLWQQVLPIFPRLVDLPLEKFQRALAHILQVYVNSLAGFHSLSSVMIIILGCLGFGALISLSFTLHASIYMFLLGAWELVFKFAPIKFSNCKFISLPSPFVNRLRI